MIQATSTGMRSGCTAHAAARKIDMSVMFAVCGEVLKMRHDVPMIVCGTSLDQTCTNMFSMDSRTLWRTGEKTAPT
jgi:hypothetical protein